MYYPHHHLKSFSQMYSLSSAVYFICPISVMLSLRVTVKPKRLYPLFAESVVVQPCTLLGEVNQLFQQLFLTSSSPSLEKQVESVEERVECRVDRQYQYGHGHIDLPRHRHAQRRQQSQHADGKPAQEVCGRYGDQAARDPEVAIPPGGHLGNVGHGVAADRDVDGDLAHGDQQEDDEVEHDQQTEGVAVAREGAPGDGQRDADAGLAVEAPVGRGRQQG